MRVPRQGSSETRYMPASIFSFLNSLCLPAPNRLDAQSFFASTPLSPYSAAYLVRLVLLLFTSTIPIPPFNVCGMPLAYL